MKKLLLLSCIAFLFSCNNDDGGDTPAETYNYFPATTSSTWDYDYQVNNSGVSDSGTATININGTTTIDDTSYQVLDNTIYLIGLMNQIPFNTPDQNLVIRVQDAFMESTLDFGEMDVIDQSATTGQVLSESTVTNTAESIPIPEQNGVTGTVTPESKLTLKSYFIEKLDNFATENYENIYHSQFVYNLEEILYFNLTYNGVEIPTEDHQLISPQDFGILDIWFADGVGIIKTQYNYSFENLELNTEVEISPGFTVDLSEYAPELEEINNYLNINGNAELSSYSL